MLTNNTQLSLKGVKLLDRLRAGGYITASEIGSGHAADLIKEVQRHGGIRTEPHGSRPRYYATSSFAEACVAVDSRLADLSAVMNALSDPSMLREEKASVIGDTKAGRHGTVMQGIALLATESVKVRYSGCSVVVGPTAGLFFTLGAGLELPAGVPILVCENERCRWNHGWIKNIGLPAGPYFIVRRDGAVESLRQWLLSVPNDVLYFPDYDLAGICIYERQFRSYLQGRIKAVVPADMEDFERRLRHKGNPELYDKQFKAYRNVTSLEFGPTLALIRKYRTAYEQEGYCFPDI